MFTKHHHNQQHKNMFSCYTKFAMELSTTPDTYVPKMDTESKTYKDQYVFNFENGIVCPCTPIKTFYRRDSFHTHWKSARHRKWLVYLNENAHNYYRETQEQQTTIKTQQQLLTEMETQLKQKDVIIRYLESQLRTSSGLDMTGLD